MGHYTRLRQIDCHCERFSEAIRLNHLDCFVTSFLAMTFKMINFPPFLEQLILGYLKETFLRKKGKGGPPGAFSDKDLKYFSKGAERLSKAFTRERGTLPYNYLNDPVLRSGYLLYFLPVNFLKVVRILSELPAAEITAGKVRILDLGSGPGTSMLGVMTFYSEALREGKIKDAWCDFTLVDQNYPALKDALFFHRTYKTYLTNKLPSFQSTCSVKNYDIRRGNLNRFLRNFKYHLIIVSNTLNEFRDEGEKIGLIQQLMQNNLEPKKGKLIVIEPALRKTSRDLQQIRNEIVSRRKLGSVYAPCLNQEVCPLNVIGERDWCHFYIPWKAPKFVEKVGRLIGTNKEWLAMSYLVLGNHNKDVGRGGPIWRVISNIMPSKGKKEVVLCGSAGRYHLTKLDKTTSGSNRSFDSVERGDLVEIGFPCPKEYQVDGRYCVEKGDKIRIVSEIE